jgi:hypothetical protein
MDCMLCGSVLLLVCHEVRAGTAKPYLEALQQMTDVALVERTETRCAIMLVQVPLNCSFCGKWMSAAPPASTCSPQQCRTCTLTNHCCCCRCLASHIQQTVSDYPCTLLGLFPFTQPSRHTLGCLRRCTNTGCAQRCTSISHVSGQQGMQSCPGSACPADPRHAALVAV